jgi:DNA-binding XRE family transcriptional regulator
MEITQAIKSRQKKNSPYNQKWGVLLRDRRTELRETQAQFGKRFDVTATAICQWELGNRDLPGDVTWWLTHTDVEPPKPAKIVAKQ